VKNRKPPDGQYYTAVKYFRYLFFDGFRRLADVRWKFTDFKSKQWCGTDTMYVHAQGGPPLWIYSLSLPLTKIAPVVLLKGRWTGPLASEGATYSRWRRFAHPPGFCWPSIHSKGSDNNAERHPQKKIQATSVDYQMTTEISLLIIKIILCVITSQCTSARASWWV
jgi:hypothetical protein